MHVVGHVRCRRRYVEVAGARAPEVDFFRDVGTLHRGEQQSQSLGYEDTVGLHEPLPRVGVVGQNAGLVTEPAELVGNHDVDLFGKFDRRRHRLDVGDAISGPVGLGNLLGQSEDRATVDGVHVPGAEPNGEQPEQAGAATEIEHRRIGCYQRRQGSPVAIDLDGICPVEAMFAQLTQGHQARIMEERR